MNRIGTKLLCLLVAILLWLQVAATTTIEDTVALPVEVIGLREGIAVAGADLQARAEVRLRGSKLRLLAHRWLGRSVGRVAVDVSRESAGATVQRDLRPEDVRTDMTVIGISPPVRLRLRVDRVSSRRLPVRVVTSGELPSDRALLRAPAAIPAVVLVRGPEAELGSRQDVPTEPVELERVRSGTSLSRRLQPGASGLQLEPSEVRVEIAVTARDARTFANLPVVPLTDAGQPPSDVFPPVASLTVSGPAESLGALTAERLAITVSLTGLSAGTHHVRGQPVLPEIFRAESLQPEQFVVHVGRASGPEGGP